ncbi:MAG: hypothetical protein HN353_11160 [Bdellovibrionales bacterium]|jgi:hypothetical protein|nr:hypothetical protein [Bdellovibrionales bacterium]MBT3525172.1 hypothetical protein [Bdellovibrionales bacterium]MBT7767878.1 hypothetical protein [Bdellovibrionales bacterium]
MRGSCFIKPWELTLTTNQEQWEQGGVISGCLEVKGDGDQSEIKVLLAYGTFKKVRQQDEGAFIVQTALEVDSNSNFTIKLPMDVPITDKSGSLYLLYGVGDQLIKYGQLQLQVELAAPLASFLKILVDFFRFRLAQTKFKKGYSEFKLVPPSTKEFTTMDSLACSLRMDGQDIEIKYSFKVRILDMVSGKMQVERKAKMFVTRLTPQQYLSFGAPNYDVIKGSIEETMKQVIKGQFLMGQL